MNNGGDVGVVGAARRAYGQLFEGLSSRDVKGADFVGNGQRKGRGISGAHFYTKGKMRRAESGFDIPRLTLPPITTVARFGATQPGWLGEGPELH
jgi:hypothetical protein